MILGGSPLGGAPLGGPAIVDASAVAPFTAHLATPPDLREDIIQLRAFPRYRVAPFKGLPGFVTYQDREWIGNIVVPVRLQDAVDFFGSVSSDFAGLGGGVPTLGSIRILGDTLNLAEGLDTDVLRKDFDWHGAQIFLRLGGPDFTFEEFGLVFAGRAIDLVCDHLGVEIVLADPSAALDVPVQDNFYGGTGGIDGDERLANTPRPQVWGRVFRYAPPLIDRLNNVWQLTDGPFEEFIEAYELGHAGLIRDADATIYTDPAPAAGHYHVDPVQGLFQSGAPLEFLTVDMKGDNADGYVETAADIVETLCRRVVTTFTDANFDLPSFAQLNLDLPAPIGFALSGQSVPTLGAVVDMILGQGDPTGLPLGYKTFTRLGALRVGIHKIGTPVRTIRGGDMDPEVRRERTQAAFWQWRLGYARRWSEFSAGTLHASITDAERDFIEDEFRYAQWKDNSVRSQHDASNRSERNTLMALAADAQAEADRAGALTKEDRDFYEIEVFRHQWQLVAGQTVRIEGTAEYGIDIDAGDYLVLGVGENSTTLRTRLQLWG